MIIAKIIYCFLLIGATFFSILYSGTLSLWLLIMTVILPIILKIISLITKYSLQIGIEPASLSENKNTPAKFKINIKNKSIFPVSNSIVKIKYFNSLDNKKQEMSIHIPIQPYNSQTITFTLSSKYCGKLNVSLEQLIIYDFLKLSHTSINPKVKCETVILPQSYDLDIYVNTTADVSLDSDVFSKTKAGDDPSEVFNFKDYQYGDKINRINWKISTKQDKLLIKEYSLPVKTNILILFEFFHNPNDPIYMEKLDTLIELVTSLSEKLADNEVFHSIKWFDCSSEILNTEPISNTEDVAIFLGKLMKTPSYSNTLNSFEQYNILNLNERYSHILYISSQIDNSVINSFADIKQSELKTILYVTDNNDTLNDNAIPEINLIPVNIKNIMGSIQELII